MFNGANSSFVSRVADFGCSTRSCGENDLVRFPESFPWNAPEWHRREFTVSKAKKMDVYSFGALCLWILFERGGFLATYGKNLQNSTRRPGFRDKLAERSNDDDFSKISAECLDKDESLSNDLKLRLGEFFTLTLTGDPGKRSSDFDLLLHRLIPER
jgi:serine/threonine protein kinase